jgi:hypothetical protein
MRELDGPEDTATCTSSTEVDQLFDPFAEPASLRSKKAAAAVEGAKANATDKATEASTAVFIVGGGIAPREGSRPGKI